MEKPLDGTIEKPKSAEEGGDEADAMNDPTIRGIYEKLDAVLENPQTSTENVRAVHKELSQKHTQDRFVARQTMAKLI